MFTGLIQNVGKLSGMESSAGGLLLRVDAGGWKPPIELGESIAVNGVCLTASRLQEGGFTCDVLRETLDNTTLGGKRMGDLLNLERSLPAGGAMGGHIVTGHVDGIGTVVLRKSLGRDLLLRVACAGSLLRGMVLKGSVACDGVSLTITRLSEHTGGGANGFFEAHLVPHTISNTSLGLMEKGDPVNIETDVIGKYVFRFMNPPELNPGITMERLNNAGFD